MSHNPHGLCTWNEEGDCGDCELEGKLYCRWRSSHLAGFFSIMIGALSIGAVGLYLTGLIIGNQFPLISYFGFMIIFFNVIETWLLCRHCPYYARSGRTLHCLANHGCIKLWDYNPSPMSGREKNAMRLFFTLFFTYPLIVQLYGITQLPATWDFSYIAYLGVFIAGVFSTIGAYMNLRKYFCAHCINFSCPLNKVPEEIIEQYLDKNPVMKAAWKED